MMGVPEKTAFHLVKYSIPGVETMENVEKNKVLIVPGIVNVLKIVREYFVRK